VTPVPRLSVRRWRMRPGCGEPQKVEPRTVAAVCVCGRGCLVSDSGNFAKSAHLRDRFVTLGYRRYVSGSVSEGPVMTVWEPVDVEALVEGLRAALVYGARASQLARYTPEVVDLLCPVAAFSGESVHTRAIRAHTLIRQAMDNIGGAPRDALKLLLCVSSSEVVRALNVRRRDAARLYDRAPRTFCRGRYETDLLYALAVEILRILSGKQEPGT
jgi:hypothetical protein